MQIKYKPQSVYSGIFISICAIGWHSNSYAVPDSVIPDYLPKPTSAEACVGLTFNSARLACYDALYKLPMQQKELDQQAEQFAILQPVDVEEVNKIDQPKPFTTLLREPEIDFDTSSSLLDQRWELSSQAKLGTWQLRGYQPLYLFPVMWMSDKNALPHSPNPDNTVTVPQDLTSTEAKFQLSFKTKALENVFGDNGDVWIGYTQSSRWQVYNEDDSRPFRETNYEPEAMLVLRTNYNLFGLNGRLLGIGFNHQSNGRSDPFSRSWNRAVLNLGFEKDNFVLMLRPWYRLPNSDSKDENPDIEDYVGRGDLTAHYKWNSHQFSLMLRHSLKGGDDSHGAMQFDWAFPLSGALRGHFQIFDGYGESLIDYNHRATYVGLGISLVNWF
ncbi:phospholipase A [Acinetobacter qingfengensis]|uniref:Phospholipase A1 n=1 Tax=Acinetobacter qingfengensis TaxID=1262585 RepID=A0A1E7RFW3_9GAMM|nr:phospholipase A [Acinetobacter qingfengensis]KAA8732742.1 phospholipase A [Acinetobacter qingfengensis]OEY98142.1 phospholipase [Acinetobacter qingfengensis]